MFLKCVHSNPFRPHSRMKAAEVKALKTQMFCLRIPVVATANTAGNSRVIENILHDSVGRLSFRMCCGSQACQLRPGVMEQPARPPNELFCRESEFPGSHRQPEGSMRKPKANLCTTYGQSSSIWPLWVDPFAISV